MMHEAIYPWLTALPFGAVIVLTIVKVGAV